MDDLIIGLIFLGIVIFSVIRKALESLGEERAAAGKDSRYEASAREIQDFLKSLGVEQEPEQQQVRAPAEQAQARPAARAQRRRAAGRMGPPAGPLTRPTVRGPRRKAAEKREEREKPRTSAPPEPEKKPAASGPSQVRRKTDLELPSKGRRGLKQAIVWSEILGPPVSLRQSRHHMPAATEK